MHVTSAKGTLFYKLGKKGAFGFGKVHQKCLEKFPRSERKEVKGRKCRSLRLIVESGCYIK